MGPGTFEAKFVPLAQLEQIEKVFVLRESDGPVIDKVEYLILPGLISKFKPLKILIPFYLAYYAKKLKCNLIIGYHFIPHAFFAYFASILSKVPFACAQTGIDIQQKATKPIFIWVLKKILNKASFINVPGNFSKDFWINFGINAKKINVLHSSIDTNFWLPDDLVKKKYDFIFLGRLDPVKRIDMIINGLGLLLDKFPGKMKPLLVVVGSGPDEKKLKELTKNLGIEQYVHFTGFTIEPIRYLQQTKFLVMSSFTEGMPTAMMQAMACGVIPITNSVGNIPDIVTNGMTGFFHNGHSSADIFEVMNYAIEISNRKLSLMQKEARDVIVHNHAHEVSSHKWVSTLSSNGFLN